MKVVISVGGSLLTKELTVENFKKYVDVLLKLKEKGHTLIVICGGGKTCRNYRDIGKGLGGSDEQLDFIGIMATHLNAATLAAGLGDNAEMIKWTTLKKALKDMKNKFGSKILVGGGYDIGTSSDFDAVSFAKAIDADILINASNINGVFSDDPKTNPQARKFDRLTHEEFFIDGNDPEEIVRAVEGNHSGTVVE